MCDPDWQPPALVQVSDPSLSVRIFLSRIDPCTLVAPCYMLVTFFFSHKNSHILFPVFATDLFDILKMQPTSSKHIGVRFSFSRIELSLFTL